MEIRALMNAAAPLLEALHDGVVVLDAAGVVVYVNEANTRITGLQRGQVLERRALEVVPQSHLLDVLQTGRELIGVRTRVARCEVVSNIVPLTASGRTIGVISVFRDLTEVLSLGAQLAEARNTIALLKDYLSAGEVADGVVIGRSPVAQRAFTLAVRAASVASPVLVEGESGTGKEVAARLIHARSDRSPKPFIALNCAAVPATLMESELFGYEEGAFTGARRGGRAGLFEMADGGTLFLDEVGDLEIHMQAKLLRALQDGEFRRIGGTAVRRADIRLISATNRPLADLVARQQFREDLYYRLRVIRLVMPPIRERREDLPLFIERALTRAASRLSLPQPAVDAGALRLLLAYDYPGNVRELENLMEQALVVDEDGVITEADLPAELAARRGSASPAGGLTLHFDQPLPTLEEVERALLAVGLQQAPSRAALAEQLGMGRATLYRKLERYGLG